MNTRSIMQNAWAIAREAAAKFGGRAAQYLAAALRQAWQSARAVSITDIARRIAELTYVASANVWQKHGKRRVYFEIDRNGVVGKGFFDLDTRQVTTTAYPHASSNDRRVVDHVRHDVCKIVGL